MLALKIMNSLMKLSDFDYSYPEELIAQTPPADRADARMMIANRAEASFKHSFVRKFTDLIGEGDVVVFNDTKVAPARIFGTRTSGEAVEILVVERANKEENAGIDLNMNTGGLWKCLVKRAKRFKAHERIHFGMQTTAVVAGRDDIYLLLEFRDGALALAKSHHGVPPLPPYIKREGYKAYTYADRDRYQTVYAQHTGSAAAPTAGFHFTKDMIKEIEKRGANICYVTLHVGIDTFAPVRADDLKDHKMHGERYFIPEQTALEINKAKTEKRRVIAIGTTAVRALESACDGDKILPKAGTTELFIIPGYKFNVIDCLLTNFHLPKSTLLMLVSAFAGRDFILSAYREATENKYRLFSFGDCMFIK